MSYVAKLLSNYAVVMGDMNLIVNLAQIRVLRISTMRPDDLTPAKLPNETGPETNLCYFIWLG